MRLFDFDQFEQNIEKLSESYKSQSQPHVVMDNALINNDDRRSLLDEVQDPTMIDRMKLYSFLSTRSYETLGSQDMPKYASTLVEELTSERFIKSLEKITGFNNIRLLPPIERQQLIKEYQNADVLFLHLNDYPAFEKVLPSKIFEYAALGKPILAGVTAVATATAAASSYHAANQNRNVLGNYTPRGQRYANLGDGMAAASGASVAEMLKRFKATSATQNSQFILTKLEDGVGLVKLNKDSGALEKEIVLKDKKPEYQVDEFGGYLYYKLNDKTIYAYNLKK